MAVVYRLVNYSPRIDHDANAALIDSWELSLHEKRPRTVDLYLTEVRRFATWLADNSRAKGDLLVATKRDVEAWIGSMKAKGLSQSTIRNRWIALRSFYRWAHDEGEVDENPVANVKVAKPNAPPPNVLTSNDIDALLKACVGTDFHARRDLAVIRFMLATGVRVSECVGVSLEDLDLRNRVAVIRDGKGGRGRLVKFDAATAAALDRYKRVRGRHRYHDRLELWIGHRGPMTRRGVPALIDKRAAEAGIGHVFPHQLRHTWADRWLAAGGREGDLQRLGGWESTEIMARYGAARAVDRALNAYDEISPMGDL